MSTNTSSFALKKHESTDNVVTALTTNQNANMEAIEDLLDGTTNDADLTPSCSRAPRLRIPPVIMSTPWR